MIEMKQSLFLPDALAIGIPEIDEDHAALVEKVNEGITLWNIGERNSAQFNTMFSTFIEMTTEHFIEEEQIMKDHDYYALEAHKIEHQHILKLLDHMENQKNLFAIDDLVFCFRQIMRDIGLSDLHFATFASHGEPPQLKTEHS